jgi:glycine oxidase
VIGVRGGGRLLSAETVINCAGAWAGGLAAASAPLDIRPIKGQMGLLAGGSGPRHTIYSSEVYIVPRSDGRKIIGTTVEDRGFDKSVDPGTVERLVAAARRLCPPLESAPLADSWAGLRPRSGSGEAPVIGPLGPAGYFVAVGPYRNGILLAPLTAEMLSAAVRSP